ncbi:MAG TPA: endonuclease domain-containing protein [Thermoplasmata archaeon]
MSETTPFRGTLLTDEQYQLLLERQGGVCAICGDKSKSGRLAIDHIHGTTKVRGLLCMGATRV